jgi:hypothetical protein
MLLTANGWPKHTDYAADRQWLAQTDRMLLTANGWLCC